MTSQQGVGRSGRIVASYHKAYQGVSAEGSRIKRLELNEMMLEIRRYESTYQTAVIDLWTKCNLTVPQNDPREDIQKKLAFQPDLFFIALLKRTVIGTIVAGYDGHRGWLNYLAVLPAYQKRGYGRQLVEKAVDELRKLGCLKVN